MKDLIKKVIDNKVKNLHPNIENLIIEELLGLEINSQKKILKYIRNKLNLPKVGSDKNIYWIKRGWSEDEAESKRTKKKMPNSPMKYENWLNKINDKTGDFYTIEEAKYKVKTFRKLNKEYWIERGYSEYSSINMVIEYQKENSKKFIAKILENPEKYNNRTQTQIGYWVKLGYSKEESLLKVKERQDRTSLKYLLSKYDQNEANKIYNDTIKRKKYETTIDFQINRGYTELEALKIRNERNQKRSVAFCKSSKESLDVILPIYKFCIEIGIPDSLIYFGHSNKEEYFLSDNKNIFFYDFTILNLNIIIEYNGEKFHPNPNWDIDKKNEWKCLFSNLSYVEKYNFDEYKNKIAIERGFDIYSIYSSDDKEQFINRVKKIIEEKNGR
jgi:hypothetical protein